MMKKTLSVILALVLAFGMMLTAFASVITSLNMTAASTLPKAGEALPTINPMGNSQWYMAASDAAFYKNNAVFTGVPEEGDVIELRADVHGHNGGGFPADLSSVSAVWNGIQATDKVSVGSNVVRFTFPYEIPLSTLTVEGLYPPQKGDPALDLSCAVSVGGKSYPALSVEYQYLTYEGLGGEPKYIGFITPEKLNTLSTARVEIIVDLPAQVSSKIVSPVGVWGDAKFSGVSKSGNRYTIWFSLQDFTNTKTPLSSASVRVDEPVAGAAPGKASLTTRTIKGKPVPTSYRILDTAWSPADETFVPGKEYTVKVKLQARKLLGKQYSFNNSTSALVNGAAAASKRFDDGGIVMTVSYKFPAIEPVSIPEIVLADLDLPDGASALDTEASSSTTGISVNKVSYAQKQTGIGYISTTSVYPGWDMKIYVTVEVADGYKVDPTATTVKLGGLTCEKAYTGNTQYLLQTGAKLWQCEFLYHVPEHEHAWSAEWSKSASGHWHDCTAEGCPVTDDAAKDGYAEHTFGEWTVATPATSESEGLNVRTCTVCGYKETATIPKHVHAWSPEWKSDEGFHWHECTAADCDITENSVKDGYGKHEFAEWTVMKYATEDETGMEQAVCSVCGYEATRETPKLAHVHSLSIVPANDPACIDEGNIEYYECVGCGKLFRDAAGTEELQPADTVIAALGHDFTGAAFEQGEAGHAYACTRCGEFSPVEQHAFGEYAEVYPADETTPGLESALCQVCNYSVTREIPATGHSMELVAAKEVTCTEAGNTEYYHCGICGRDFADEAGTTEIFMSDYTIDAPGHDFLTEFTDLGEAGHARICARCGEQDAVFPHTEGSWTITKPASTTEEGEKQEFCPDCGALLQIAVIPKLDESHVHGYVWGSDEANHWMYCMECGQKDENNPSAPHQFGDWATETAATETEKGRIYRSCTVCGYVETLEVPETGHVHTVNKHKAKAADCKEPGNIEYYVCKDCGLYFADKDGVKIITESEIFTPALGHDFAKYEADGATGHYAVCARCGEKGLAEPHIDENGDGVCDVCGYDASAPTGPSAPDETSEPTTAPVEPVTDEEGTTAPEGEFREFTVGDVNMDGRINSADARLTLRAAARVEQLGDTQLTLADVDGDGKIKAGDARTILRIAARLEPRPEKVVVVPV